MEFCLFVTMTGFAVLGKFLIDSKYTQKLVLTMVYYSAYMGTSANK